MVIHTAKKNNKTSAQGSTRIIGPGVADVELPTDVEVSIRNGHGAAAIPRVVVLAAREAQHGWWLHEAVAAQTDAGIFQGSQGDHREVSVEVDRVEEVKAVLQEERDALRGIFCWQDGQT